MSESIYILGYSVGEYSYRQEEIICAFKNESEANSICEKLQAIEVFISSTRKEIDAKSSTYKEALPQIAPSDAPKVPYNCRENKEVKDAWEEKNRVFLKEYYASANEVYEKTTIYTASLWKEIFDTKPEYKELFSYYNFQENYYSSPDFYVIKTELK